VAIEKSEPLHPASTDPLLASGKGDAVRVVSAEALLAGGNEVRIRHNDVEYRLQLTRQGKLILTK
jgi:hemin uptake protein HemP